MRGALLCMPAAVDPRDTVTDAPTGKCVWFANYLRTINVARQKQ